MKGLRALVAVAAFAALGVAQHPAPSTPSGAAFDKLKSLAGEWQGTMVDGGKQLPATTSYRIVSGGSVVMNVLGAGTPYEMVTMFHMDGHDLMMTHYCAAHNQPRMLLAPAADPKVLNFQFKDATNLASPSDSHMVNVKITFLDANHHLEDWTSQENGKSSTGRFDFHRKL